MVEQVLIFSGLKVSGDGFVRISYDEFNKMTFNHTHSELVCNISDETSNYTDLRGFTEWISNTAPAVSISWDWKFETKINPAQYVLTGMPFSNIMFVNDDKDGDFGTEKSLMILKEYINTLKWQDTFIKFMNSKYS